MSNATIRRDHALLELRKVADTLEALEATALEKANTAADGHTQWDAHMRDAFVGSYVERYVRDEVRLAASMVRFAVSRLEPKARRPGRK